MVPLEAAGHIERKEMENNTDLPRNVTKTQLSKMCSEFQRKYHTASAKARKYAAQLYDIEHGNDPEPTNSELKAIIEHCKTELDKTIIQRQRFKIQAKEARSVINSLRSLIIKLKEIDLEE